jgi:hypothetical protein
MDCAETCRPRFKKEPQRLGGTTCCNHRHKIGDVRPAKNPSMREGNQNDKIDVRRLAEPLRLSPGYHGAHGLRRLKELVRSYLRPIRLSSEF